MKRMKTGISNSQQGISNILIWELGVPCGLLDIENGRE